MNLGAMADLVTRLTKLTSPDNLTLAKDVISQGYEEIWKSNLWKDSVEPPIEVSVAPSTNTLHAAGIVELPRNIHLPLAVRESNRPLGYVRPEYLMRSYYDWFNASGTPLDFYIMPPAVWESTTGAAVTVTINAADVGVEIRLEYKTSNNLIEQQTITPTDGTATAVTPTDGGTITELLAIGKDATTAAVTIAAGGTTVVTMAAADTKAPLLQRIRLVQKPTAACTLRVLGKRPFRPLTHDNDEPIITGVENVLMALAKQYLYEHDEEMEKKAAALSEYQGLLQNLIKEQAVQQADSVRFIPEGDDWNWNTGDSSDKFDPLALLRY